MSPSADPRLAPRFTARAIVGGLLAHAGVTINGGRPWDIRVHDDRVYRRLLLSGSLALGESYMDGAWDCADLGELIFRLLHHRNSAGRRPWVPELNRRTAALGRALLNLQTRARARDVVAAHYDLDPRLFEAMLGETMAYSCAYWAHATTLDGAQRDKLDLVCRKLRLKRGDRVLDLGCGFGAFARFACEQYGCSVVGVNLSAIQAQYARRFCRNLPVEIHTCDYRDVDVYYRGRPFDSVVSIGMFEAVGRRNFRQYMAVVHRVLKDDALWLLHTIGDEECSSDPWVTRYVFPNGELPALDQLVRAVRGLFHLDDLHSFGSDYVQTLTAWTEGFHARWATIQELDSAVFTDRFYRMWTYYLACSAGSFRARNVYLWQIVMSKGCLAGGYRSVR
jgi:cyclopropane-fatty-acyl-phospholipid synthase